MEGNNSIYKSEINIALFGFHDDIFKEIVKNLESPESIFIKMFSIKDKLFKYEKYLKISYKKKIENNKIIEKIKDKDDINKDLIINIFGCEANFKNDENNEYKEFIKEKIDFFLILEDESMDIKFLNLLYEYSKGNYLFFGFTKYFSKNKNESKSSYDFMIIDTLYFRDKNNADLVSFKFDEFIININKLYNMFEIFQKYSIEKNIVKFKDYIYTYNKYSKIESEKDFFELFNKFEKLSFNDDYTDDILIMIQIMSSNKEKFNNDISFNVKSLKCGFCNETLNICEFEPDIKDFLCSKCRFDKKHYNDIIKNSKK